MTEQLVLDPNIRNYVLFPIVFVLFFVNLLRHNISKYFQTNRPPTLSSIQERQALLRAKKLRASSNKLPLESFLRRRAFFNNKKTGFFAEKPASGNGQPENPMLNAFKDPNTLVDMMKKNMVVIIPQILLMTWVNHFFSGFIAVKFPFPVTLRFKSMLQRGIELDYLDVSYVSSLSWYFLALFGLRGLNSLILKDATAVDDAAIVQQQMGGAAGAPGPGGAGGANAGMQPVDIKKVYASERDNLELVQHKFGLKASSIALKEFPHIPKK